MQLARYTDVLRPLLTAEAHKTCLRMGAAQRPRRAEGRTGTVRHTGRNAETLPPAGAQAHERRRNAAGRGWGRRFSGRVCMRSCKSRASARVRQVMADKTGTMRGMAARS